MFSFCKMQGTGNDFVVVDCIENEFQYSLPILAEYLCNRHYGVGADGVIFIYKSENADFKMRIFNSDGSEAEMCGNGVRCFAKYVFEKEMIEKAEFSIETLAGIKKVKLELENNKVVSVEVNMGNPEIDNIKYIIEIEDKQYQVHPINMGNPHAVCFVKNVDEFDVEKVGSIIEDYKYFPNKTNVEFVEIIDKENIKIRVWERGVGETKSCGTGACASAMIAIKEKFIDNKVNVKLKGGKLEINYNKSDETIFLKGPAEKVFEGQIEIWKRGRGHSYKTVPVPIFPDHPKKKKKCWKNQSYMVK